MLIQTENPELMRDTHSRALSPKMTSLFEFRKTNDIRKKVAVLEERIADQDKKLDAILNLLRH